MSDMEQAFITGVRHTQLGETVEVTACVGAELEIAINQPD